MFFSSRIHRTLPRRFGALVLSGALVASFAGFALANPANAAPTAKSENYVGNLNCANFAPAGVTWEEFKIEGAPKAENSPYKIAGGDLEITISNASSQTFDWASNFDMSAILVKGSAGGIHYQYPGANDKADTGLHAVVHDETKDEAYHGISHVTFCYKAGGDTPPVVVEPAAAPPASETPASETPAAVAPAAVTPAAVTPAADDKVTVLGETLVRGDTLPRTGATATHTLALAGGLGLAFGLMMLMLARRKTAIQSS